MDGTTFFEHFSFMLAMDAVRPSASFFSPSALVAASLASASALPLLAASASALPEPQPDDNFDKNMHDIL